MAYRSSNATVSAFSAKSVTPTDNVKLTGGTPRALYIGTTGNLAVILDQDTAAVTFTNVPVGIFPIQAKVVMATNTTASGIIALY